FFACLSMLPPLPVRPSLCPYTTLFRSIRSFADDVALVEADLTDAALVAEAVRSVRPDWIFHLAAYGAYPQQRDLRTMQETNVASDRKSTRLNSSHLVISYAAFCLKKKS